MGHFRFGTCGRRQRGKSLVDNSDVERGSIRDFALGAARFRPALYAANSALGYEVRQQFFKRHSAGLFTDPICRRVLRSSNIQNIGKQLYVSCKVRDGPKHDEGSLSGPGKGCDSVLIRRRPSQAPGVQRNLELQRGDWRWADQLATFSKALLVGNFWCDGTLQRL